MKTKILIMLFLTSILISSQTEIKEVQIPNGIKLNSKLYKNFDEYPIYNGDLGLNFWQNRTTKTAEFKVWSPAAEELKLSLYKEGNGENKVQEFNMNYEDKTGLWFIKLEQVYEGLYYTFQAKINGKWMMEVVDPYAKAVGVNGQRDEIIDFSTTNPSKWTQFKNKDIKSKNDIILYETHIRDLSMSPDSGIKNKGKFLGFTETGTKNNTGLSTGIDHIKELGITHLHILPAFDFKSIDETQLSENKFNWGYDPQNYNVPEGSYSTNPYDGTVRIKEFKQMVQAIHNKNISVVMDVVYNHTGSTNESVFNQLVPGYYYRQRKDGSFSDAAACGNETASDRFMFQKYMIESLEWWMKEYKIDGFRFDLMAIHDIETMNLISEKLHKINPDVFLYGEGWTAGDSPLPIEKRALKQHENKLQNIAVFSDDIRDGIKGHWSNVKDKGFVSGNKELKEVVKFGIVASTKHSQIKYDKNRNYAQFPYSNEPAGIIGYVSCHDNNTLRDKLKIANPNSSEKELIKMAKLANTIVFTSQSVPFLHMGEEINRTKKLVENSYNSPDSINQIQWKWKTENKELFTYYKNLIQLRKSHPAFKMKTTKEIQQNLKFIDNKDNLLIEYTLNGKAVGDSWNEIYIAFNGENKAKKITFPAGNWKIVLDGKKIDLKAKKSASNSILIPEHSAIILIKND